MLFYAGSFLGVVFSMSDKFEDTDDLIDDVDLLPDPEPEIKPSTSKAWRDIEKLREERELKKQLEDDLFGD